MTTTPDAAATSAHDGAMTLLDGLWQSVGHSPLACVACAALLPALGVLLRLRASARP